MSNHGDDAPDMGDAAANKARLTLRLFEGKNDARATRNFCMKVDGYRAVARLTDEETAQAVSFAMVPASTADLWLTNLAEKTPDMATRWTRLRPLIIKRFSPDLTASERATAVDNCRQKKSEDVPAFLDQCQSVQLMMDRQIEDDEKDTAAYRAKFDAAVLELFLKGLREDGGLKAHVNGAFQCTNLEQYLDYATRYERHIIKQVKVVVAEVATDIGQEDDVDDEDGGEVANLKVKKKKNGNKGFKGGANTNSGRGRQNGGRGGGRGGGGGGGPPRPRLCWTCNSPDHLNLQCPDNPNRKKGGGGGGGRADGGSNNHASGSNQVDTAIYQLGIQALLGKNSNKGQVETLDYGHQQPPPQYQLGGGGPASGQGFY